MNVRQGLCLLAGLLAGVLGLVPMASASRERPPRPDLVASYSFDEPAGRLVRDSSAQPLNGRLLGARRTRAGRLGGAVRFRRPRDVVRVRPGRARAVRRALTLEAWVRPAATRRRGWGTVVAAGPARRAAFGLRIRRRGRQVGALVRTMARRRAVHAVGGRRARGWRHVACTYDGRTLRLFVDGAGVSARRVRGSIVAAQSPLRIGGSFAGMIDEVKLYRRALSPSEIRAGSEGGRPSSGPGQVLPGQFGGSSPSEASPGGSVPVYDDDRPPPTPTLDELPRLSSVSKDGVTWTFSKPAPVGRFVTGDPYVVGATTVTGIDPQPAGGRHGSVKNLPPVDDETGFDSRTAANRYDASLRSNPPVSLVPGDALVSSISVEIVGAQKRWLFDKETGSPVKSISVLTAVAAPQPPDAFRPSYVGRGAPRYFSRNLRRELLPRRSKVADTPSLAEFGEHFRRPWVDSLMFTFDSPIDYMPDYAREISRAVGMAGLLLTLDHPAAEKEPLLVGLTQYGIDLHGLLQAGHPGWPAHGGHGSGRKLPIVLAGTLLGEPEMQRPPGRFGEDMQTMTGTGWTGASALYAGHYGSGASGEYGPYEHLQPATWPGTLGEDYRRCCTSSAWIGEALTARLVPGVQAAWNHPPFFSYADRWMTEDDSQHRATIKAQTGKDYGGFPQRRAWDRFVTNMWQAYR